MTTLAIRVDEVMREKGCTVTELAKAAGVKPPSVIEWLNGETKTLKASAAIRASRFLGVEPLWLAEGEGPKRRQPIPEVEPGDNRLPIRRALFRLSAGVSGYEIDYEQGEAEPIFMARRWFEQNHYRPDQLLALKVSGRSMEPSLYDGDLVIVNLEDVALKDGQVFAANYEGELVIKRLRRDAGQWYLTSDSPDKHHYSDKRCSDGCGLIGRIVYRQTEHI